MKLIIPDLTNKEFRALLSGGQEGVLTLRGYVTPERMTQVALAAIRRTPELLQCRVESLLEALTLCMEYGLEPDGHHAHLLAQGDSVVVLFDWKGLVLLGRREGVEAIHADVVCDNDDFGIAYDGGARLTHEIDYKHPRGEAYAVYCYFIAGGEPDAEVMTREEIERQRAEELAACPGNTLMARLWEQDWASMAKRVVLTRASHRWVTAPPSAPSAGAQTPPPPVNDPGPQAKNGAQPHAHGATNGAKPPRPALEKLRCFMLARQISEASMLDYLKDEGRIADYVTQLADVPEAVIEDVVTSWVGMAEEEL